MRYLDLMTELKTLLAPVLGVYRRNNGDTFPAIIGLLDEEQRPAEYKPEGLECIIRRSPFVAPKSTLCDGVQFAQVWRVYLLQWPLETNQPSAALETATRLMAQRWGGDFSGMPQKPEGNAQDQYYVKIQDYVELIQPDDAIA